MIVAEEQNEKLVSSVLEQEEEKYRQSTEESNSSNLRVVVTGASGFVGSHCIKRLLEQGYKVIGSVRSDPKAEKYRWLFNLTTDESLSANLTLMQADLMEDGSFDDIVVGCDFVLHVASPYIITVSDPLKDLVEPAKFGTLNVLKSCLKACIDVNNDRYRKLRRVIITSSFAAVTDSPIKGKIYTEEDWNERSSLTRNVYFYSKTVAEKAAWDWIKEQSSKMDTQLTFDLVTANPVLVVGPELNPDCKSLNTSNQLLVDLATGKFPMKMNLGWVVVDVRDVADAHILLMSKSECKGRHLVGCQTIVAQELFDRIEICAKEHEFETSIPCCPCNCKCCFCFIWCLICAEEKGTRDFLRTNINGIPEIDNSKLINYGFKYRDMNDTLSDTYANLLKLGYIQKLK